MSITTTAVSPGTTRTASGLAPSVTPPAPADPMFTVSICARLARSRPRTSLLSPSALFDHGAARATLGEVVMATLARGAVPVTGLVLLVVGAILLNYVDRGTIAVAAPLMKGELGLTATGFGIAVSAFFWVYAPIQLAVGWLCDRFPVYRLLALRLLVWGLSTAAMVF